MRNPPPLALLLAAAVGQRILTRDTPSTPTSRPTSAVLGAAAAAVLLAPVVEFRRQRTTVDPRSDASPTSLVTGGINAYTRNPMYVGMTGLLLANAARRPRPTAMLPVMAFTAWIDRRQIPTEEQALRTRFGSAYADYCARVPRWAGRPLTTIPAPSESISST